MLKHSNRIKALKAIAFSLSNTTYIVDDVALHGDKKTCSGLLVPFYMQLLLSFLTLPKFGSASQETLAPCKSVISGLAI